MSTEALGSRADEAPCAGCKKKQAEIKQLREALVLLAKAYVDIAVAALEESDGRKT